MDRSEKGCEWRLGVIINKIEISTNKINLINYIYTQPNPTSNIMLAMANSGVNIHLAKQATSTMASVIISNYIKSRLIDGSTMESSHISTLQIPGLSKQAMQIHISQKCI